jgi:hypothetical protein
MMMKETEMKKILLGTIAAVAVFGASAASAQTFRVWDEHAAPVSYAQDYQLHYGHYTTSPYANTGNSAGYNANIADVTNLGG